MPPSGTAIAARPAARIMPFLNASQKSASWRFTYTVAFGNSILPSCARPFEWSPWICVISTASMSSAR